MSAFTLRFVVGEGLLYSVAALNTLSTRKADTNTGRNVFISLFILVFKDRSIALSQNLAITENCKQQGILALLIKREKKNKASPIHWCLSIGNKLTFSELKKNGDCSSLQFK